MKNQFLLLFLVCATGAANAFAGDYPFEVKITGKGSQSIIFIPGYACSGDVWNETRAKFESNFVCHTLTMAGFAGVKPKGNPTFKTWESAIAKYIQENKISKPIVIGHSMGGTLALAIAADYPQLIEKIVVVDALPCLSALMNPSFKVEENNDCSEMISQMTSVTDEQFYQMQKMTMSRMVADTSKQEKVVDWSVQSDRTVLAEIFCDFLNTDLRESVKSIQCPALVLLEAGFKNMKAPIEAQFGSSENLKLKYANKGLHFIMYDDPNWYFSQLNDFLISE